MRLNKRENVWMRKLNAWIPEPELEAVQEVKGDISTSLFVRRAIKKAVNEARMLSAREGERLPAKSPQPAVVVPNATTTTTTPTSNRESKQEQEVEV
jgi:hypothetical protein